MISPKRVRSRIRDASLCLLKEGLDVVIERMVDNVKGETLQDDGRIDPDHSRQGQGKISVGKQLCKCSSGFLSPADGKRTNAGGAGQDL